MAATTGAHVLLETVAPHPNEDRPSSGAGRRQTHGDLDGQLRGTPGAIAVLHTHTRRLDYHPHVHPVVPAAAPRRSFTSDAICTGA